MALLQRAGAPVPDPGALLVLAIAAAAYYTGWLPGLICSVPAVLYTLAAFSTTSFLTFAPDHRLRALFSVGLMPAMAVAAGLMGRHAARARALAAELRQARQNLTASEAARAGDAAHKLAVLDGVGAAIALLDARGVILTANTTWHAQIVASAGPAFAGGSDYVDAMSRGVPGAPVPAGVRAVLRGELPAYEGEYFCPSARRWFRVSVTPLPMGEERGAVVVHLDVTAHRAAEEQLRQSRAVLEQAQHVAAVGSWVYEPSTRALSWSPETHRLFGIPPEQFDGRVETFERTVHPDDRQRVNDAAAHALATGAPYAVDHRIIRPDGAVLWVHEQAEVVPADGARPARMIGVVQDVTQRKHTQEALQQSEERYRLLFELNPQPMWVLDRETRTFTAVNQAALRKYGYARSEFLGMPVDRLRHPEDRARFRAEIDESPHTFNRDGWRHLTRDGRILEVELTSDRVMFQGRDSVVVIAVDVTERRRSERLLAAQNLVLGLLAGGAPLEEALSVLIRSIESLEPTLRGVILALDPDGATLRAVSAPSLSPELQATLREVAVGPTPGASASSIRTGRRIVVADLLAAADLTEAQRAVSRSAGIAAAWAQPIIGQGGKALGVFTLYSSSARAPSKRETKLLESTAYLAGLAMERKQAEADLRASEELLRHQFQQMPVACLMLDGQRRITQWNPAAERIFGFTAQRALGRDVLDFLVPPEEGPAVADALRSAFSGGTPPLRRNQNLTRAGRVIICEWQNVPIRGPGGEVIGVLAMAQDVTERLAADEALRRSETLNRRIIEHMPGGLVQVDMQGHILTANGHAQRVLGLTHDELTGRVIQDFDTETIDESGQRLPWTEYPVAKAVATGLEQPPRTIGVRRPDGQVSWGVYTAIPLFDTGTGSQTGAMVTFVDITARKAAEQRLRESEERLLFAQESAQAGAWDWDAVNHRLNLAETTYRLFGLDPAGDALEQVLRLLVPEDLERIKHDVRMVEAHHRARFSFEYRIRHPQQGTRWISCQGRAVFDDQGRMVRMAGINLDTTELKAAQQALARSEERYRRLAEHGAMGIWEITQDGATVYANPALCRILEIASPDELRALSWRHFFQGENLRTVEREHRKRLQGIGTAYEVQLTTRKGNKRRVMISGAPAVNPLLMLETFLATVTDITDLKNAEEALRQAQKLDAVGRLASGVAHDFNNLLTAIFGFTALGRRSLTPDHPAYQALQRVDEAATQASSITKGLLSFAREDPSERRPVLLADIVSEAARLLRRILPGGIELVIDADADHPVWAHADTTQIHQVLMNLALNARDAMPGGGRLTIAIDKAGAGGGANGQAPYARLTVSDTGTGMSPEVRDRIFEPFFTTKPAGQGTGLGLAITHGIVREHGGRIEVDSEPGRGTTIRVLLPLGTPEDHSARPTTPPVTGGGETVLLADHHTYIREIMASMLQSLGYRVVQAGDAAAATEALRAHPDQIRVAAIDAELPGDGSAAPLDSLRALVPNLPCVLMSPPHEHAANTAAQDAYILQKPFQIHELAGAIAASLGESRHRLTAPSGPPEPAPGKEPQ
jgi:PAS domain S-box-containing protein